MKTVNVFLAAAYARSLVETVTMVGAPLAGLVVFAQFGAVAGLCVAAGVALLASMLLTGLSGVENRMADDVGRERLGRDRPDYQRVALASRR